MFPVNSVMSRLVFPYSEKSATELNFNDPVVQKELVEGVMVGTVTDGETIAKLANCVVCIGSEEQKQILDSKLEFFFGVIHAHPEAMVACRFFTAELAQMAIAGAIYSESFGADSTVLIALVDQLKMFTSPTAQQVIAHSIVYERFGAAPDVLAALAGQLGIFTDDEAQLILAEAIEEGKSPFSRDTTVLSKIDEGMNTLFTNPVALQILNEAKTRGRFNVITSGSADLSRFFVN